MRASKLGLGADGLADRSYRAMRGVSTRNLPQDRAEVATLILAGTSAPFGCQRLDIWGLGMVLYESATGHRPSRRARPDVQLRKHAAPVRSLRRMPATLRSSRARR